MSILLFLLGFALLIKGADFIVEGASSIARRFNVPDLVIGLTLVSFGTSLAELFVNLSASTLGNNDVVMGNIIGSNIFNASFILGVAALIYPLKVTDTTIWKEIPLSLLAAVVLFLLVNDQFIDGESLSVLSRIDGLVLLVFFMIFLHYTFSLAKSHRQFFENQVVFKDALVKSILLVSLGLVAVIFGGQWVVSGAIEIAQALNVSETFIGLTVVAAGTSLPELAASCVAAYKKKPDIAVANIVGSNIFNIFFILGVSSVIKPVKYNPMQNFDIGVCLLTSLLMFVFMFTLGKSRFDRREGVLLVSLYLFYVGYLIFRG